MQVKLEPAPLPAAASSNVPWLAHGMSPLLHPRLTPLQGHTLHVCVRQAAHQDVPQAVREAGGTPWK